MHSIKFAKNKINWNIKLRVFNKLSFINSKNKRLQDAKIKYTKLRSRNDRLPFRGAVKAWHIKKSSVYGMVIGLKNQSDRWS